MEKAAQQANVMDHSMPAITGLRGLAALWVLVYHAWVYVTPREIIVSILGEPIRVHVFFSLGWSGVHVLFVLSGFLLTLPYARAHAGLARRPRVLKYLARRIARVFPAYYAQLFLLVVIAWFVSNQVIIDPSNVLGYLLMLFVPPPLGIGPPGSVNGVWWTLPIELSFYLVLPFIAWLAAWRWRFLLLLVSLLSMATWRYFVLQNISPSEHGPGWMYQLPGSMDTFGLGMLGAVLHVHYSGSRDAPMAYRKWLTALLCLAPVVFVSLGIWMARDFEIYWTQSLILFFWTPIFGAAVLVVILNCAQNRFFLDKLLGNRPVFYMGTVSYGIYLWHYPIGKWLMGLPLIAQMQTYQFPRLALLMFAASLLVASASWFLVEARAIAWVRRTV